MSTRVIVTFIAQKQQSSRPSLMA